MLKRTTQEVAAYFQDQGCELLDEYRGVMIKMKYRCKCGEIGLTSWNNFTKGKRCGKCSKYRKRYTLDEIKSLFTYRGCELLEEKYRNNKSPMKYRCKCGRVSHISLIAFMFQEQTCYYCGVEKNTGSGNPAWVEDREELVRRQLFRKKCYSMLRHTLKTTGKAKVGHTSDMLGYGPKELQEHVVAHPNWQLVKDGEWHLDHIFPIEAFLGLGITDIKLINSLENLQPLSQTENNRKHAKYNKKEFRKWLKSKGVVV